ncbi:SPARC-like protein 1 [Acipenser ruthenus]|uniref:SPARC-like protein 1 n=1 Tax=Acipenser ruthenus TaxID=7906 RepID=UPI002742726D|nr:SPARC-like protein 1 [Acipenser ruthenus]
MILLHILLFFKKQTCLCNISQGVKQEMKIQSLVLLLLGSAFAAPVTSSPHGRHHVASSLLLQQQQKEEDKPPAPADQDALPGQPDNNGQQERTQDESLLEAGENSKKVNDDSKGRNENGSQESDGISSHEEGSDLTEYQDSDAGSQKVRSSEDEEEAREHINDQDFTSKEEQANDEVQQNDDYTFENVVNSTDIREEDNESQEESQDQDDNKGTKTMVEAQEDEGEKQEDNSRSHQDEAVQDVTDSTQESEISSNDSADPSKDNVSKKNKNVQAKKATEQGNGHQELPKSDQNEQLEASDNTVEKSRKRKYGKQASVIGMNPVLIRATEDLYPQDGLARTVNVQEALINPCEGIRCKRGKTCKANEENKPECVCQDPSSCLPSVNEFEHVCGTDNKTYDTSCQLFATKCSLEGTKKGHRLHLDYTGSCKYIAPCLNDELAQFPLRMRDWLKNVLLQLFELDMKTPGFLTAKQHLRAQKIYESQRHLQAGDHSIELLARDFEKNYNMYIYPVHWQFAQMDQHQADRHLSHSELASLRAPLIPMEHCTSQFFQECDADKDKQVSFKEWCYCFGIKDEDMDANLLF